MDPETKHKVINYCLDFAFLATWCAYFYLLGRFHGARRERKRYESDIPILYNENQDPERKL